MFTMFKKNYLVSQQVDTVFPKSETPLITIMLSKTIFAG